MTRAKASNGAGSITERTRSDGVAVYDLQVSYRDDTGRSRRHTRRGFRTRTDAAREARKVTAEVDRGRFIAPSRVTVGEWMDSYLAGKRASASTLNGYRTKARLHITPHLGHVPLSKLSGPLLSQLYRTLEAEGSPGGKGPLSPASVREVHTIISGAMRLAVREGLIGSNPAASADPPTAKDSRPPEFRTWSGPEVARFLDAESGSDLAGLWRFLFTTGCRRGEVLGLRWADVDLDRQTAAIRQTVGVIRGRVVVKATPKSGRARAIDLDAGTVAALRLHRVRQAEVRLSLGEEWHDEGLVFARAGGRLGKDQYPGSPLNGDGVARRFDAAVRRHGLPDIRLHDARHTWATLALAGGVHAKVVQERLGHASIGITLGIYSHVVKGMQAEAAETVASMFVAAPVTSDAVGESLG